MKMTRLTSLAAALGTAYFLSVFVVQLYNKNPRIGTLVGLSSGIFFFLEKLNTSAIEDLIVLLQELESQEKSAGIIDNDSDAVIYRNQASVKLLARWKDQVPSFQAPINTRELHNSLCLSEIKNKILETSPCASLKEKPSFSENYTLTFPKVGLLQVCDNFYRFDFNGSVYRIWVNVSCHLSPTG